MVLLLVFLFLPPLLLSFVFTSGSFSSSMFLLFVFFLLLGWHLVQQGAVLLGQRSRVQPADIILTIQRLLTSLEFLPEPGQLQLVEKHQLLPAHRRFLYQLPQAGVILAGPGVDDAWQTWQEAGETVLHLLCWRRGDVSKANIES